MTAAGWHAWAPLVIAASLGLAAVTMAVTRSGQRQRAAVEREQYIRGYAFPASVLADLRAAYPHLDDAGVELVVRALRDFFLVHARAGRRAVGMPSKAVDELWHAFILHTQAYQDFCQRAFGSFFHHVPASAMGTSGSESAMAMRRTFRLACQEAGLVRTDTRLPLLFTIDWQLAVPGAVAYTVQMFKPKSEGGDGCVGGSGPHAGLCAGGHHGASSDGGGHHGCGGSSCGGH